MPGDSRSTIAGVLALTGRPLSAPHIAALARPLGLTAANVKSHLTRMTAEGDLTRQGRTRLSTYAPSRSREAVIEAIRRRLKEESLDPWDGSWLLLALPLPHQRPHRDSLRAALWFDGFRAVAPGAFVRPAWPLPWALDRARSFAAEGSGVCLMGAPLAAPDLPSLYDLKGLDKQAASLAKRVGSAADRLVLAGPRNSRGAFAARLRVGGEVIRMIAHDPRLPPAIWDGRTGMSELVRAYERFERAATPLSLDFIRAVTGEDAGRGQVPGKDTK